MPEVLGAGEGFEGEGVQELALAHDAVHRFYLETCLALEVH